MWVKRVRKCSFFPPRMCLSLYDYQSKARRYRKVLLHLKNRLTTNQKYTIDSQKPKTREHKHNTKENLQTTKGKRKRKEQRRNIKSKGEKKVWNGNKYISNNNFLKCQWTKYSNQKTHSGRLDKRKRAYNMLPIRDPL